MNNKKGFTLIELLVVIAIIGLLSTIAVVALNGARMKARDAKRLGDVKQIQTALELYYNEENAYPLANAGMYIGMNTATGACLGSAGFAAEGTCGSAFMSEVPSYPAPRTDGDCDDDLNTGYYYRSLTTETSTYALRYCLGADTGGVSAGEKVACELGVAGCPY
ncbi:MAG: type II secretion system protein [bacterium]